MEGDIADLKEESSFEILPHLSEDEMFTDLQKYRYLNKYRRDPAIVETNSISTSSVWNISDTEFYDIKNPLASDIESNVIFIPCPHVAPGKVRFETSESEMNSSVRESVSHCNGGGNSVSDVIQMNDKWKSENGNNQKEEFQSNIDERTIQIVSDEIMSTTIDNSMQIVSQGVICDGGDCLEGKEGSSHDSENKTEITLLSRNEVPKKSTAVKVYRGRSKSSKRICQAVNKSLKLYKWFQRNLFVRTFLEGAKSSFHSFVSLFEDFDPMMGFEEETLKLTIVAEDSHCRAIEEAFSAIFCGRVSFSSVNSRHDSIPVLSIGQLAGVQTAEMKIRYARQIDVNNAMVSTSTLLHEAVPQRWQMMTVICLDDPKLHLQMHNFTLSTPIPNEYVAEVGRCTPACYISRESGLAICVEEAVANLTHVAVMDAQEFLTGFNSHTTLKSAALVLAGMYKKYIISPLLDSR